MSRFAGYLAMSIVVPVLVVVIIAVYEQAGGSVSDGSAAWVMGLGSGVVIGAYFFGGD